MGDTGRYCFVSDIHLGAADPDGVRERSFVHFLESLPGDVKALFLLGDIFDFWVDYRDVVPRGCVRTLAALAKVAERIPVYFFRGNHDWWVTDYFEKELGVRIVREPYAVMDVGGWKVCMGHGDTLGCRDWKSKLIFHLFRNRACIALLRALPPRWVFALARKWAAASRKRHAPMPFSGREMPIYAFADAFGKEHDIDLYIFGHWHSSGRVAVESGGEMILLSAWSGKEGAQDYLYLSGM